MHADETNACIEKENKLPTCVFYCETKPEAVLPGLFIISHIWLVFNPDHNSMPGTDNNAIVEVNKLYYTHKSYKM